jgi:hypothetical protein
MQVGVVYTFIITIILVIKIGIVKKGVSIRDYFSTSVDKRYFNIKEDKVSETLGF